MACQRDVDGAAVAAGGVPASIVHSATGLPPEWTPRELRHSFVSLMSAAGAPVDLIARLVGHSDTNTTETVYRHELRPVITDGADIMEQIFAPKSPDFE